MTSAAVTALNTLTRPLNEARVHDVQASHQDTLLAALCANRALLLEQLQGDRGLEEVRRLREEVMAVAQWFSSDTEDATWGFVQECLLLLLALTRHLSVEVEVFNQSQTLGNKHTAEGAPPLPPDVLSVSQQKTLGAALQFVVSLGLCPYLAPGVGVPLGHRSVFAVTVEKLVHGGSGSAEATRRLLTTTSVLLQLAELSSLATLVFTQHLGDVMAALCQLGYQPHRATDEKQNLTADERQTCRNALGHLLGRVYQPIVIKELLVLQGGPRQCVAGGGLGGSSSSSRSAPAWLRRLCGQLLSERLMQPNGVHAVVRAVLGGGTGGESDWRKCDSVARILVACPQQSASMDSYYGQILDLLHHKDKLTAQQFQRVATRASLFMVQEKPHFAQQYLLAPLLAPLHRCSTASGEGGRSAAVDECELTRCVEDTYKICVVGNSPSAPLLKALEEVLPVVFTLFCFTKRNVSHLRAPCQDILLWYLSCTASSVALSALKQLSGLQRWQNEAAAHCHFTPGSEGGAKFDATDGISAAATDDEDDEEEEALYEKLSEEQWRLECLMSLLSELTASDLPGDFFLHLLQELTSWTAAAHDAKEDECDLDVSAMTLLEVEQQLLSRGKRRGQRLVLLQVLAVMVESVQHSVLLRKPTQVVDFIVSLVQRACVALDQDHDLSLENPVESQTLSMGMGLVATLLSGPPLCAGEYTCMSRLLPPLETLAEKHPEVVIQELASNLRAVIATHGAYRPENATAAATRTPRRPETRDGLKQQKMQTEGEKSRTSPRSTATDVKSSLSSTKPFSDWMLEACDPDVPTRVFALRVLTQMVQNKNPEALHVQEKVVTVSHFFTHSPTPKPMEKISDFNITHTGVVDPLLPPSLSSNI
ncbi:hypothetical protein JOB18_009148 [Solea senegalensis]|uniref:Uncharacterized protein n=1 Tax=Solea senegalensis TaxID=28829 RepID=A0AAV6PAZ2_SOLSE|nr:hypothetical protein JOB18_009148 [Solea senegalensis]